ncbi:MAG TPA: 3-isopropylmalate dehydrogenase [Gammaproteobacteria bacterium]|jgi:3-isopropylmalate dehydrogenase|nr:3-isopropylmalate dehydrogenase [Gammaproteobacteria bacterium]
MSRKIVVLAGDGVGPEVTAEAVRVLKAVSTSHRLELEFEPALIGGAAYDAAGSPLPDATVAACKSAAGILLGAVGGPKWADIAVQHRPEQGLLAIRKALGLFANLRPVTTVPELAAASPLKPEKLKGVDIMVIRELTGGIYFGKRARTAQSAFDTCEYTTAEIERVCRVAGKLAMGRRRKVTSVDKANVLDTSRLWRDVATRVFREEFPQVTVEHLLVDAAAMHLLSRPADFDVMVTENMFGDILTDEASMLAGSMGLLPSASLGAGNGPGLYEPIHGSAPDIAGQGVANPCGTILSAAMLLRYSCEAESAARAIEAAVAGALKAGARTRDIAAAGARDWLGTAAFTDVVLKHLASH